MGAPRIGCGCPQDAPLQLIEADLQVQSDLGRLLERIADALPHRVPPSCAMTARDLLKERTPYQYDFRIGFLFPLLRKHGDENLKSGLNRVEAEYQEDRDYSEEIVDVLDRYLDTDAFPNPNTFGYMLRGMFASERRRQAWEKDYLLPRAWQLLPPQDLENLREWLIENAPETCSSCASQRIRQAERQFEVGSEASVHSDTNHASGPH